MTPERVWEAAPGDRRMTRSFASAADGRRRAVGDAGGARPVAGGTDLVVGARQGKAPLPGRDRRDRPHRRAPSDRSRRTAGSAARHARDPRRASWRATAIRATLTALADASAIVGSHATRAQGTIGGNVMNASPAMDTGGPLLCFGATATLRSAPGERTVALDELWTGPGYDVGDVPTSCSSAVDVPAPAAGTGSRYVRLEYRRQMEIAVVGATAVVTRRGRPDRRRARSRSPRSRRRSGGCPRRRRRSSGPTAARGGRRAAAAAPRRPRPRSATSAASAEYRSAMAEVIANTARSPPRSRGRVAATVPIPASPALHGAS